MREKEIDMTQSYDKISYANRKPKKATLHHKTTLIVWLHGDCGLTWVD